jgi:ABC-type multidrug transport system fused ATPase/permease subunit
LAAFFYYQATSGGVKLWGYKDIEFPRYVLFKTVSISSRNSLLLYSLFCFFVGNLLINLVCDYLKNYSLELCRNYLRRLIINSSEKKSARSRPEKREILNNFLSETELFTPLFILVPHKIFSAGTNIILTIIFLGDFRPDNFSTYFILFTSLIIAFLSFFTYQIQSRISQKINRFRRQENAAMEKYLENQIAPQKVKKLIKSNFQKTRPSFLKKTLSYLPNLLIPGLSILFCFACSIREN